MKGLKGNYMKEKFQFFDKKVRKEKGGERRS